MIRNARLWLLFVLMLCMTAAMAVDKVHVLALFPGKAMLSIDGSQRVLANGETSPEGVKLVSATPTEAAVILNGERRVLELSSVVNTSYQKPRAMEVRIMRNSAGSFVVNGTVNGRPMSFMVDTGANVIAMSEPEARRLNIPYQMTGMPTKVTTAGGPAQAWAVKLNKVSVGEIALDDIAAVVIQGDNPPQTLLGMSFLGQLQIGHSGNLMTLTKNR